MEEQESVKITSGRVNILGDLIIPAKAKGAVIFAHGSGSSRFSPRNKFVAAELNKAGIATLLIDLLTRDEEAEDALTAKLRFNIELLTERLISATHWLNQYKTTEKFNASTAFSIDTEPRRKRGERINIGYFGASTGAAGALVAASKLTGIIKAVVSRGGRPDLAGLALPFVKAPTLLIVGEEDPVVIDLNESALKELNTEKKLVVIPKATHLFEEPGALEKVAGLAAGWFLKYL